MDDGQNPNRCSRIEILGTMIREFDGEETLLAVPREKIRQISLSHETLSRHPFFLFFSGFTLLSIGALGIIVSFFASFRGALPISINPDGFNIQLIPLALWVMTAAGLWCLAGVLKAGYYLQIETEEGQSKMFFGETADLQDIQKLIRRANWTFGYQIDTSVLESQQNPPDPSER